MIMIGNGTRIVTDKNFFDACFDRHERVVVAFCRKGITIFTVILVVFRVSRAATHPFDKFWANSVTFN